MIKGVSEFVYLTIGYPADGFMTRAIKVTNNIHHNKCNVKNTFTNARAFSILIEGVKEWIIAMYYINMSNSLWFFTVSLNSTFEAYSRNSGFSSDKLPDK